MEWGTTSQACIKAGPSCCSALSINSVFPASPPWRPRSRSPHCHPMNQETTVEHGFVATLWPLSHLLSHARTASLANLNAAGSFSTAAVTMFMSFRSELDEQTLASFDLCRSQLSHRPGSIARATNTTHTPTSTTLPKRLTASPTPPTARHYNITHTLIQINHPQILSTVSASGVRTSAYTETTVTVQ